MLKKTDKIPKGSRKKAKKPKGGGIRGKKLRQTRFIKLFPDMKFHVSDTCAAIGIDRRTYCDWMNDDPEFAARVELATEAKIDEWEKALHANIAEGDTKAVIFALKTKGKHRGYVEKETVNQNTAKILEKILSGELTPREAGYQFAILGLPLPEVLKIELSKQTAEEPDAGSGTSVEELDKRYQEAIAAAEGQREGFLPIRQAEVAEIKESMKHLESFKNNDASTM